MSLIDRVAQHFDERGVALRPNASQPRPAAPSRSSRGAASADLAAGVSADAAAVAANPALKRFQARSDEPSRTSQEFVIDFNRLREMGYITPYNRRSRVSEEVRLIKRRLMQRMTLDQSSNGRRRGRQHVVLVTSSRPAEGKSFTAVNLALSIVLDEGYNVLLADADIARPSLRRLLNVKHAGGLTDLLQDDPPDMADVLMRERNHPLSFLSSGNAVASATDLFGSARMKSLMDDVADRYDDRIIIFDAPPLLASTEPVVLAQHVGQIVFVIDAGRTSRSAVESALDLLDSQENVNLVLNRATAKSSVEQFGTYYDAYNAGQELRSN